MIWAPVTSVEKLTRAAVCLVVNAGQRNYIWQSGRHLRRKRGHILYSKT
jgi:hypothetical protein